MENTDKIAEIRLQINIFSDRFVLLFTRLKKQPMPRNCGTRRDGSNFSEFDRRAVWEKEHVMLGKNPAQF